MNKTKPFEGFDAWRKVMNSIRSRSEIRRHKSCGASVSPPPGVEQTQAAPASVGAVALAAAPLYPGRVGAGYGVPTCTAARHIEGNGSFFIPADRPAPGNHQTVFGVASAGDGNCPGQCGIQRGRRSICGGSCQPWAHCAPEHSYRCLASELWSFILIVFQGDARI